MLRGYLEEDVLPTSREGGTVVELVVQQHLQRSLCASHHDRVVGLDGTHFPRPDSQGVATTSQVALQLNVAIGDLRGERESERGREGLVTVHSGRLN